MTRESSLPKEPSRLLLRALAAVVVLLVVALSATLRIRTTLEDPGFDRKNAAGILRSDPALLYYFTDRIVEAHGAVPADFRADPRIEHPHRVDVPADFSVGQEFLVAWTFLLARALGSQDPLHVWCLFVMSSIAALTALGVYGVVRELCRGRSGEIASILFAGAAALWFALLPGNYRTLGVLLIREDLAVPLLALASYAIVRARRTDGLLGWIAAGVLSAGALATWHAMGFVVAAWLAVVIAWFCRTGHSPFRGRAWIVPGTVLLASFVVPMLWQRRFLFSLPAQLCVALAAATWLEHRRSASSNMARRVLRVAAAFAVWLAVSIGVSKLAHSGLGDYSHVFALMRAKVEHLGVLPEDPAELSFGARLLWQGPFETGTPERLGVDLGLLLPKGTLLPAPALFVLGLGLLAALRSWWRADDRERALCGAALVLAGVLAWLVVRNVVIAGVLVPIAGSVFLLALRRTLWRAVAMTVVLLAQAPVFAQFVGRHLERDEAPAPGSWAISWYQPLQRNAELARLTSWIRGHRDELPEHEAVAADFINSTAVLAQCRNPILLQPKYETAEARRRCQEFLDVLCRGDVEAVRQYLARYDCRYLLIDRRTIWSGLGYVAGFRDVDHSAPPASSALARFSATRDDALRSIPGFRLLYRSPEHLRTDLFRLFEVVPTDPPDRRESP